MKVFLENPTLLINEYNEMASVAQKKAFITVGVEIQKEEIKTLEAYRTDLLAFKSRIY